MNLKLRQQQIAEFVIKHQIETTPAARTLDLMSEVGEVAKEVLKGSNYGKHDFHPTPNWESELADALFSLICLANRTDVNLDAALDGVLAKYRQRLIERGDAGSGN